MGDFYLRGLQIVVAGVLFSFWGGCVLFGVFYFFPLVQKNGLRTGRAGSIPNGEKMFHCRTQEA